LQLLLDFFEKNTAMLEEERKKLQEDLKGD